MGYNWSKVSAETARQLLSMQEADKREFANTHKISLASLERRLRELKKNLREADPQPTYDDYLVLKTDNVIIISDTEFPDVDMQWIDRVMDVGAKHGIQQLIWAGDIFAFDYVALSRHPVRSVSDKKKALTMSETVDFVREVQDKMASQFKDQYAIGSNHDDRFNLALGGNLNIGYLLPNIKYYPHDYCYVQTTSQGIIKVVHPDSYSMTPVSMMHKFYNAEQGPYYEPNNYESLRKCHFVCAHTHITSFNYSADGCHKLISIGTLRDPRKTQYYMHAQTGLPKWSASFALVADGVLNLIT